jgi:Raf kinase inhibitor-like YbhB/YbcL family protein
VTGEAVKNSDVIPQTPDQTETIMRLPSLFLILALAVGLLPQPGLAEEKPGTKLQLSSPAFAVGESLPDEYTCKGNRSPVELTWSGAPAGTKSFAIIFEDPDAIRGTITHWAAYNISASLNKVKATLPAANSDDPYKEVRNGPAARPGYIAPCPRPATGAHRYTFRIYALDALFELHPEATRDELLNLIQGHILAEAELIAKYEWK